MQTTIHEKAERASAEIPEPCEMMGQRIRRAPTGWIIRASRHSTRTSRKRWSMKKDGIILVCTLKKNQVKETRKKKSNKRARQKRSSE